MTPARTLEQWKAIIEQQQASGLTVIEFCEQNNIKLKAFYNSRVKLGLNPNPKKAKPAKAFVKAKPAIAHPVSYGGLSLKLGDATLALPKDTSPQWLAQLLKAVTS